MHLLITGSTGMIGSRLVEKLKGKHTIIEAARSKGIDITKKEDVQKLMKKVDVIIHAAAEIDETKSRAEVWGTNVEGTRNLLEAAEEHNVKQFIFLSSVGVYGETKQKLDEKSPLNPITPYEVSKKEAEELVWNYQEVFPVTILRPALVMGPNSYWKGIFKIVKKGFPLIGKGENGWQMVHVDEVVSFIEKALHNEDAYNEAFVVAEKEQHTLRDVVNMIADIQSVKRPGTMPKWAGMAISHVFGIQSRLTGKKNLLIPAHVKRLFKHREYDISKAQKLGWKPTLTTYDALKKTYAELKAKGML